MNIDPKKAKQLGCTAVCPVPLRKHDGMIVVTELPSTPHRAGLCVVLIQASDVLRLRVVHVQSGFALGLDHGDYPATKVGMAAALHEITQLLPLTDWTHSVDDLANIKVEADAIVQRCRLAFPGKLVGNVVKRNVAEPAPEIVKWRVYSQDTGEWSFVDLAHEDHLFNAVDEALAREGVACRSPLSLVDGLPDVKYRLAAYDFERALHVCDLDDDRRTVIVDTYAGGFALCCEQRTALIEKLAQAERELRGVDNPRKTLGVWKSGPKFGQLKLSGKLHSPSMCLALLAQQDRYDAQARKVEVIKADVDRLNDLFAESEPIPECVTKLCPRETPDGKDEAVKLLGLVRTTAMRIGRTSWRSMFEKCVAQLEKNLREYESVELHGFAPRSRCILLADPNEPGDVDREVEVSDVIVSRGDRWQARQRTDLKWWEHERDVVYRYDIGQCFTVNVRCLKAVS